MLIDDSIVRGTTSKHLVESLRRAGAKEVHFLVASPVVQYPCYFGIDTPYRKELIGANHSLEEIREIIGCDSLGYLSMEGMYKCFNTNQGYCVGCFNGIYPVATPIEGERYATKKWTSFAPALLKDSGVNIEEGYKSVKLIKEYAQKTISKYVLNGLGSFAGMVELPKGYKNPVLVSGTDGVGTKLELAFKSNKYDTVGIDCVAMCVNDILCHGAKPLFFLDYIACGKLEAEVAAELVKGISHGCIMSDCALVGGETAEMPGFYKEGEYDIAGFAVGIVDKDKIINGKNIKPGDKLIGIASSGIHSNGFSLVRKLYTNLNEEFNGKEIWKTLITPTKIYVKPILRLIEKYDIKGMSHITGGGFIENIPRMFNGLKLTAEIKKDSYPLPAIFEDMIEKGVNRNHMYNTFNMGIGFVLCVDEKDVDAVIKELYELGEKAYEIGVVTAGGEGVCLK